MNAYAQIGAWGASHVLLQVEAEAHYFMARRFAALGFDLHALKAQAEAARLSKAERTDRLR